MERVLVFGSSGSIGKSTLEIIRRDRDNFKVLGLLVNKNIDTLYKQIKEFNPLYVCVVDEKAGNRLEERLPKKVKLLKGNRGLEEFSSLSADNSVIGITGISSLKPLLIAMKHSKRVALASKEVLVVAGEIVIKEAKKNKVKIIPVDSEINALFQLFGCIKKTHLKKIYLTASGGPLLDYAFSKNKNITLGMVLSHPTWRMGKRITVDSATLVNKGFEVMESHYLFDLDYKMIDVVVHRQSYVHAFLETKDNMLFSCWYKPNMIIPISFSLYYPHRCSVFKEFNLFLPGLNLSFEEVNYERFPLFRIVLESAKRSGNFPVVVNAADELAVEYFLKRRIKFYDIYRTVEHIFSQTKKEKISTLDAVYFWDKWARIKTKEFLEKICG